MSFRIFTVFVALLFVSQASLNAQTVDPAQACKDKGGTPVLNTDGTFDKCDDESASGGGDLGGIFDALTAAAGGAGDPNTGVGAAGGVNDPTAGPNTAGTLGDPTIGAGPGGGITPGTVKLDPTKPDPTKPDPTKPDPTKPDPTKPDPTKPDPTKPGTAADTALTGEDAAQGGEIGGSSPLDKDDPTLGGDKTGAGPLNKDDPALGGDKKGTGTGKDKPIGGTGSGNDPSLDLGGILGGGGTKGSGSSTGLLGGGSTGPKATTPTTPATTTTTPNITVNVPPSGQGATKEVYREGKDKTNWLATGIAALAGLATGLAAGSGSSKKGGCKPGKRYRWNPDTGKYSTTGTPTHICNENRMMTPLATTSSPSTQSSGTKVKKKIRPAQKKR